MKQINRYYLVFGVWCIILAYAVFFSNNVYFNAFLIFVSLIGCMVTCVYIEEHANEKESKFGKKLVNLFGISE